MSYIYKVAIIFLGIFFAQTVLAADSGVPIITEIMFDPLGTDSGREWIEVYYEGLGDVTSLYLRENEINHSIKVYEDYSASEESPYLIIADNPVRFLEDFPDYTGYLFDSAFSLKNTGELLQIVDRDQNILFSYEYIPPEESFDTAFSLHINSSDTSQEVGVPSPGSSEIVPVSSQNEAGGASGGGLEKSVVSSVKKKELQKLSVEKDLTSIDIPKQIHGIVGIPIKINPYSTQSQKKVKKKFNWAYGDGNSDYTDRPSHIYQFPGEYLIIGSERYDDQQEHIMYSKVVIEENPIVLQEVDMSLGYLVVENTSKNLVNIEKFKIITGTGEFIFPDNTLILGGATLKMSLGLLGKFDREFSHQNTQSFTLEYPQTYK